MSERKTAEIKFRIEPSVKARWQAQAADETNGNLSELIGRAMERELRPLWVLSPPHVYPETAEEALARPDEMSGIPKEDADRLVAEGKASWTFEGQNG